MSTLPTARTWISRPTAVIILSSKSQGSPVAWPRSTAAEISGKLSSE